MRSGNMPQSLYQNWQFAIEVNGFDVALFHKGQEPKTEFEEVAFAPGGSMFDQKVAGRVKFEDITLEKGILQDGSDQEAIDWVRKEVDVNAVTGGLPNDYLRDIDIVRYDRTGNETPTMAACRTMCMIPQTYIATVPDALQFALSLWVSAEPACKIPDAKEAAEIELKFCAELTDRIKGLRQHIIVAETEEDGVLWACNAITKAQLSFSDVQGGELDYLMPCDEYFDHAKETAIRADNSFPDNVELSVYEFLPRYTYYEG